MLCYCKKCGRVVLFLFDNDEQICDYCKNKVFPVPKEYLNSEFSIKEELKQQFIDKYIKISPEFDQCLFDSREKNAMQHINDFEKQKAALTHGKSILEGRGNVPKCPTCGSTNLERISLSSKVISTALFGLLSTKRHKTFCCKNCGYQW